MFLGFLAFARLASVMKFFDAGDQFNRLSPGVSIRGFQPAIKEIDALRGHLVQPGSSLRRTGHGDKHSKNSSQPSMPYLAASSLLMSSTSFQGAGALCCD
jgi:hypothetical protein